MARWPNTADDMQKRAILASRTEVEHGKCGKCLAARPLSRAGWRYPKVLFGRPASIACAR
jgi:hypothetical protein